MSADTQRSTLSPRARRVLDRLESEGPLDKSSLDDWEQEGMRELVNANHAVQGKNGGYFLQQSLFG